MKEIEILVKVEESKDSALSKLKEYNSKGVLKIEDYYFKISNEEKPITKWLRLRKTSDNVYLAFKEDHMTKEDTWLYSDEYETEVRSFEKTKVILEKLGFRPLVTIKNEKHVFEKDNFEIVLEDVTDLGLFLEVEKLNPAIDEDVENTRKTIFELLEGLNIRISEELHFGKPELMLMKKNKEVNENV